MFEGNPVLWDVMDIAALGKFVPTPRLKSCQFIDCNKNVSVHPEHWSDS